MNKSKSILAFVCFVIGISSSPAESQTTPLRVSCNLPLSGDLSVYGTAIEEGVRFYQESLAKNIQDKVVFDWQDNAGNGVKTLSAAKMQLASKPDIYVSGVKPQYMVIEDVLVQRTNIPNFAWVFDSFLRAKNKNNFRTWVNFKSEADLFLKYIGQKKNIKKVAIVHVITPTVVEQQNAIILPALGKLGLTDSLVVPYQIDQLDFKSIALKVKSFKPDQIFLSGFQHNMSPLIRSFRALSLIKEDNTVATYDLLDAISLMRVEELEGIRFTMPAFLLNLDEKMEDWKSRFRLRFKKDPLYTHVYAHEMATILYDLAERHDQDSSKSIFELLSSTSKDGLIGKLAFDQDGDLYTEVTYGMFKNGRLINSEHNDF